MQLAHRPGRRLLTPDAELLTPRNVIEGLVALVALVAFLGVVAGVATWGLVHVLAAAVG